MLTCLFKVSEVLRTNIRQQLGSICDSSLNCEMSELESLCEEILDQDQLYNSNDSRNKNTPNSRNKRSVSSTASSLSNSSHFSNIITTPAPTTFGVNHKIYSKHATRMAHMKSRSRLRLALLKKKKRRRRRRSRIKLFFKMIGCIFILKYDIEILTIIFSLDVLYHRQVNLS